jgi:hypothetical protein
MRVSWWTGIQRLYLVLVAFWIVDVTFCSFYEPSVREEPIKVFFLAVVLAVVPPCMGYLLLLVGRWIIQGFLGGDSVRIGVAGDAAPSRPHASEPATRGCNPPAPRNPEHR